jgi:hypothetical protein
MNYQTDPKRAQKAIREAKLRIVADCYKKGFSYSRIAEEIAVQLNLPKPPTKGSIHNYVQLLLADWRSTRLEDMDLALQLELERIDDSIRELWDAWEKSKQDQALTATKTKGQALLSSRENSANAPVKPTHVEKTNRTEINYGDPRYIAEIRMQLAERRKLLGLYSPEKSELTGAKGQPLVPPASKVDLSPLTPEEKASLLAIARKVKR